MPYGPATLAPETLYEVEILDGLPLFKFPVIKVPATADSFASGQPSPSESKSSLLGIPSSSVSVSVKQFVGFKKEKPCPSVFVVFNNQVCLTFNPLYVPLICMVPIAEVAGVLAPDPGLVETVKTLL